MASVAGSMTSSESAAARRRVLRSSRALPGQSCAQQAGQRRGRERARAQLGRRLGEEVLGQQRDVAGALAQRRQAQLAPGQAMVEVEAEAAGPRPRAAGCAR